LVIKQNGAKKHTWKPTEKCNPKARQCQNTYLEAKQKLQSKIRKFVSFEAENIVDFHFEVKNVKQKNVKTLFGNGTKNATQN
jgi:hypothetical protein